jgi:hypothetical protein
VRGGRIGVAALAMCWATWAGGLAWASDPAPPMAGASRLSLLIVNSEFGLYETADHKECPKGFNPSQHENYLAQFPNEADRLAYQRKFGFGYGSRGPNGENVFYNPTIVQDPLPFHLVDSQVGIGLDLDGRTTATDFVSPDGKAGVDNQLYRVLGCIEGARRTGTIWLINRNAVRNRHSRLIFDISGIDDARNDPDVTIRTYRGLDPVYVTSEDKPIAGGTQHIDQQRSARYMATMHGRIVDGVLITDPIDFNFPLTSQYQKSSSDFLMKAMRLEVKLTDNGAQGFIGGYADIATFFPWFSKTYGAGSIANAAHWSPPSVYKALNDEADAYPDPKTGQNTAISMALKVELVSVQLVQPTEHEPPPKRVAALRDDR